MFFLQFIWWETFWISPEMLQWSYSKNSVCSYLPFDTYKEVTRQKKCQMPVWNTHVISRFQYCAITFPEGIIGLYSNTDTFKIKNKLVNILLLCISLLFDFSNAPAGLNKKRRLDTSDQLCFKPPDFFQVCILNAHLPIVESVHTVLY